MTGRRFDSCCDTRKCGFGTYGKSHSFLKHSTSYQYSRVVKGGALKMRCVCFLGSSPSAGKLPKHEAKLLNKLW